MKTSVTTFICAMALTTTIAFGNHIEDKAAGDVKKSLPASVPAMESPAPEKTKSTSDYNKYSPSQKAAIVELKLKGTAK